MPSVFEKRATSPQGSAFERRAKKTEKPESFGKSSLRTAYQIPSGIAQAATYPADILQMMGTSEALDPEFLEHLRGIHEREGIPFDEDEYLQQVQNASSYFPTQGNIERIVEEETGAPLQPKNKLQKSLKLGATAGKLSPGSLAQKGTAAIAAPSISQLSQKVGVPEPLSDILGLAGSGYAASKVPGELKIGAETKPSGLTTRRYEKLKNPKEVSSKKIQKINEKVESEFRNITNNILEKSPINETYSSLKNDTGFKQQSREAFKDVSRLAEEIPEKISTEKIGKELVNQAFKKKGTGFSPSEYDKAHEKFVKTFIKETPKQEVSAADLVTQYRKNNEALSEIYEPGQSFAYNRAKRQALSDYNKSIAATIEKEFPDSEFSNLFKTTNKKWSEIMDAESIDKFMDKLFDGKIKFEKGKQFFDKEGMTVPFKRALGEKGFKDFEQLMKDLMSTEQASKMMKVAESKGFSDLASTGLSYLIHPSLAKAKVGAGIVKGTYRKIYEALLDQPQLAVTWDKGVKAFKKGDFLKAEKEFNILKEKVESIEKFNSHEVNPETVGNLQSLVP